MPDLENTATLDRLTDAVQARLPGVLYDLVRATLWDTIEDFCGRTSYWSRVIGFGPGTSPVTVFGPSGAKIYRIIEVYGLSAYNLLQPDQVESYAPGDTTGTALVALCPIDLDASPDFLLRTWFEAFYEGTLSRLYAEQDKPYSSKDFAEYFSKRFESYVEQASLQALRAADVSTVGQGSVGRLLAAVRAGVGNVAHANAQQAIWTTIQDFCDRTAYQTGLIAYGPASGGATVTLSAPAGQAISRIQEVYGARAYTVLQPDRLTVYDAAPASGHVLAVLGPASLDVVPDALIGAWFDTFLDGALARLHAESGRPYSSADLTKYHTDRYEKSVLDARSLATSGADAAVVGQGSLTRLYAALGAAAPGVGHAEMQQAVWSSVQDFLARSTYWTETVAWLPANSPIMVPAPSGTIIQRILEVYDLSAYSVTQPNRIAVFDEDTTGRALVALIPTTLDAVPETLLSTWYEAFLEGSLARIHAGAGRPQGSEALVKYYTDRYEKLVEQAGRQATRFVTNRPTRSADIDRLYMAVRSNLDIDTPQTVIRQMAWNTIEDFYIQSLASREHVHWRMAPGERTINFDPFDEFSRVAWILDYRGLTRGKVEHPSILRDLSSPTSRQERCGEAWLALKPINLDVVECCAFGDLWSTWFEPILAGCLYRLFIQPGRTYSNPKLAEYYYKQYRKGVATARDTSGRGYSAGRPTAFPYYARGHQGFGW